jgi:iron(III) transport system permease protein
LCLGEAFYTFPHALMILLTTLAVGDARLYEAAGTLGAGRRSSDHHPARQPLRRGIGSAAGVHPHRHRLVYPNHWRAFPVLAVEAYKQVIGQQNCRCGNRFAAAVAGCSLFCAGPACSGVGSAAVSQVPTSASLARLACAPAGTGLCSLIGAGLLPMMGTAIAAAFIRQWPYQMTFTLAHFNFDQVDGGGWLAFGNSLRMALATRVLGSILVFLGAWSSCKLQRQTGRHAVTCHAADGGAGPGAGAGLHLFLQ